MAQTNGCNQFEVTDPRWTECVQDQATAGGLMPWIVVIPLGVMVVGMFIGFARQFSDAGRARARAHGVSGTAGGWLIFVSFIELAIGIGSWIGDRRAPGTGGYTISAVILSGVGVILFVIGVFLKVKGRRRARIYHEGVPGEAVIRAVHETGTVVNNQPMYAFDLDVSGQGFNPVSTRHREVVPFWYLNRVGPQSRVPVKVDPQNPARVIFDWDAFAAMPAQPTSGATPAVPVTGATIGPEAARQMAQSLVSSAEAMQAAQGMTRPAGSGWHVGKVIGMAITLFVFVVVGGALFFVARVLGGVGDITSDVTDQVAEAAEEAEGAFGRGAQGRGGGGSADTKIEVSRTANGGEPVKFSVALPAAWNDLTASVPERQGPLLVDVVMKPQTPSEARIVVTRSVRFMDDPAPPKADIGSIRAELEREYGDSLVRSRSMRLAGEAAIALDIAAGADGLRSRQVAVMRGGQVIFAALTAPAGEWGSMEKVFDDVLASWSWGTVSA